MNKAMIKCLKSMGYIENRKEGYWCKYKDCYMEIHIVEEDYTTEDVVFGRLKINAIIGAEQPNEYIIEYIDYYRNEMNRDLKQLKTWMKGN